MHQVFKMQYIYLLPKYVNLYSTPNPFSANIRQCDEESERFKEERNTVEYERKVGRFGLCG
jgi:hypothetical protein